ncbi:MAG: NTP transferase domain-containing protein [Granulosicoccus sp.]
MIALQDSLEPYPYHRVTAVLLAGGSSKRFGRENKLVADHSGSPLINHALNTIVKSEVRRLIVVLGYDAQDVKQLCSEHLKKHIEDNSISVEYVVNTDFESGMGSSLKAGVSTLANRNLREGPTDPHAALVCLADMPSIKPATINRLMESISQSRLNENSRSSSAFVPAYKGKRGNPVLLMPEMFDQLLDLSGDFGARHLLQANPEAVMEIAVDDAGIFLDCDTPEQLQANKKNRQ